MQQRKSNFEGHKHSDVTRKKISIACVKENSTRNIKRGFQKGNKLWKLNTTPHTWGAKISRVKKEQFKNIAYKEAHIKHLRNMTPQHKLNISKARKKLWQNKEYRERMLKIVIANGNKRPTSIEKKFIDIIKRNNLPYKYVGDGSFWIGYKNPDFISTNNKKVCIEVAYAYWKIKNYGSKRGYEIQRGNHFSKYGWKTKFFWGDETEKTIKEKLV